MKRELSIMGVHPSHCEALTRGRAKLGVPPTVSVYKTLTPRQIAELRERRLRHLIRHRQIGLEAAATGSGVKAVKANNDSTQLLAQRQHSEAFRKTDLMKTKQIPCQESWRKALQSQHTRHCISKQDLLQRQAQLAKKFAHIRMVRLEQRPSGMSSSSSSSNQPPPAKRRRLSTHSSSSSSHSSSSSSSPSSSSSASPFSSFFSSSSSSSSSSSCSPSSSSSSSPFSSSSSSSFWPNGLRLSDVLSEVLLESVVLPFLNLQDTARLSTVSKWFRKHVIASWAQPRGMEARRQSCQLWDAHILTSFAAEKVGKKITKIRCFYADPRNFNRFGDYSLTIDNFASLVYRRPRPENYESMKSLTFRLIQQYSNRSKFDPMFQNFDWSLPWFPNLVSLTLNECRLTQCCWRGVEYQIRENTATPNCDYCEFTPKFSPNPNLQRLRLHNCTGVDHQRLVQVVASLSSLTFFSISLTTLENEWTPASTSALFRDLLFALPVSLKFFHGSHPVNSKKPAQVTQNHVPLLTSTSFARFTQLEEFDLDLLPFYLEPQEVLPTLPSLRTIPNIVCSPRITAPLPHLTSLNLFPFDPESLQDLSLKVPRLEVLRGQLKSLKKREQTLSPSLPPPSFACLTRLHLFLTSQQRPPTVIWTCMPVLRHLTLYCSSSPHHRRNWYIPILGDLPANMPTLTTVTVYPVYAMEAKDFADFMLTRQPKCERVTLLVPKVRLNLTPSREEVHARVQRLKHEIRNGFSGLRVKDEGQAWLHETSLLRKLPKGVQSVLVEKSPISIIL